MTTVRNNLLTLLAVIAAAAIGVVVGVAGHERILGVVRGGHADADQVSPAAAKELWTCSMHPQVIRDAPGLCPICHMQLTPLGAGSASSQPSTQSSAGAIIRIDPTMVQNMGVRTAPVTNGPVTREIRAVGYLDEAQPNVRDVNLRVSGWVERLYADTLGMALSKGAPLFDLYSPEVRVAIEELIGARKSLDALPASADALSRKTTQTLFDATRLKLEQWGIDPEQVKRLSGLEHPPRTVAFTSPIDGYLTQKMISQGTAVKAGDTVLRIVDLSTVWLDAQVYAQDLPFVRNGQKVTATVEGGGNGAPIEGEIVFVSPQIDPQTRTATVRVALPNMELSLRPGTFATAHVHAQLAADALLVPREAVIDTGRRQVAFVSTGGGHFEPREVKLGPASAGGAVQVREGLAAGETVVTSGQFLLDAESRMQEAIQKHLAERSGRQPAPPVEVASHAMPPTTTTAPAPPPPSVATSELDEVFRTYLKVQAALGASEKSSASPVDPSPLVEAAKSLAAHTEGHVNHLAGEIADAAAAMKSKPLPEQRKLFKPLSDDAIALADASPPSRAVADKLFVAFCPMAPGEGGRWLQPTDSIANPYFATSMKECGKIERAIQASPSTGKGGGR
jgi:RND family efflux transporter MFP subunit